MQSTTNKGHTLAYVLLHVGVGEHQQPETQRRAARRRRWARPSLQKAQVRRFRGLSCSIRAGRPLPRLPSNSSPKGPPAKVVSNFLNDSQYEPGTKQIVLLPPPESRRSPRIRSKKWCTSNAAPKVVQGRPAPAFQLRRDFVPWFGNQKGEKAKGSVVGYRARPKEAAARCIRKGTERAP